MRNHVPMLAALVLLGCNSVGVPDGGIVSKDPITGNGNEVSPLTIADGGILNQHLANPGINVMTGLGLTGSTGKLSLGETLTLALATPVAAMLGGTGLSSTPTAAGQYLRSSAAGTWGIGRIDGADLPSLSGSYVDLASDQTIGGNKMFMSPIVGSVTGSAASFTGMLAGDVIGAQSMTRVTGISGTPLADLRGAKVGQVLAFDGMSWAATTPAALMLGNVSGMGAAGMLAKWTGTGSIGTGALADGGDTISLFTGHDAAYYVGNSAGTGKYGALQWVDAISSVRLWHQSNGGIGGLWLNAAGYVGLGVPAPLAHLHVSAGGTYKPSGEVASFVASDSWSNAQGVVSVVNPSQSQGPNDRLLYVLSNSTGGKLAEFIGGGNYIMAILANGNVGVGTTSPKTRLHVYNGNAYIEENGGGVIMKSPNGACWLLNVTNAGAVAATATNCP